MAAQSSQGDFQARFAANFRAADTNVHWDRPDFMQGNAAFMSYIGGLSPTSCE